MRTLTIAFATILALTLSIPALADKPNPYTKANNSWISISGTVQSVGPDSFALDYGKSFVTVEMDDYDWDNDGYKLITGDKVTVYGRIDDDLFETTSIEASSVYVENAGQFFYANSDDEEDFFVATVTPVVVSSTIVQGQVASVNAKAGEFHITTPNGKLRVEVDRMGYDPLDSKGFQKVEKGDRVSVNGSMEVDFWEGRELEAQGIVTLRKGAKKKDMSAQK